MTTNQPIRRRHHGINGPRRSAPRFVNQPNDTIEHRVVILRTKDKGTLLGGFHKVHPGVAMGSTFRRRDLRNFPDGVWIFDCSDSIDGAERIAPVARALKSGNSVPTFLSARQ